MSAEKVTPYTFPYIEPGTGTRAKQWTNEELDAQREQFLTAGRRIVTGYGQHRKSLYEPSFYHVVEDAVKDVA